LAPTEGLVLELGEHGRVVVRPSGTEPKLKAYVEILGDSGPDESLVEQRARAQAQLSAASEELSERLKF
jgi:phosphomannomutase